MCVCLATFTIYAIVVVHCLDNCCLLFKKCAHEGGCQGAAGLIHSYLFHLLGAPFSHTILYTTICLNKSDLRQNMYPKWCPNPLKMYFQIAILFCSVFLSFLGALKSQNMCLGHACAVQITSGTDHMAHEMGGQIVRKGTQIHQESMTRTSPRKDMDKSGACLENVSNMCQKWSPKG